MIVDHLQIDGFEIVIEFKSSNPGFNSHTFDSYVARIKWDHKYDEDDFLIDYKHIALSAGSYDYAVNWALTELENTSFFLLKHSN